MTNVKAPSNRNLTADFMKGLAVLAMIQVHLMELFAKQNVYDSFAGRLSLFIGGVPAAPVFMVVMGYFLVSPLSFTSSLERGFKLIFWGLLLNIGLNFHLIYDTWREIQHVNLLQYIFGADILFLAGFAVIFIGLFKLIFKNYFIPYIILALVFSFFGPFIPVLTGNKLPYLMAFAGGNYPWSYFPLFPWLAYPLAGYACGLAKDKINLLLKIKSSIILISAGILFFAGMVFYGFRVSTNLREYYHHGIVFFIWAITFISCWTKVNQYIAMKTEVFFITRFISWLGKNVTAIYVIQWLIIGNIATQIWKTQTGGSLVLWGLGVLALSVLMVYLKNHVKEYYYGKKEMDL